jgi:hypothetical protein
MEDQQGNNLHADKSIIGWSDHLRRLGYLQIAHSFDTDPERDLQLISLLGLPRYDSRFIPAPFFVDHLDGLAKEFFYEQYFLTLVPVSKETRKFVLYDFPSLESARECVLKKVGDILDKYMVRISEFEPNTFGGIIICDDGLLLAEMGKGLQANVAYGMVQVASAQLSNIQIATKYNTSNVNERSLLWKAIKSISRSNNNVVDDIIANRRIAELRGMNFLKGYFEFIYTQPPKKRSLRLVFLDVKLQQAYYNLNIRKAS